MKIAVLFSLVFALVTGITAACTEGVTEPTIASIEIEPDGGFMAVGVDSELQFTAKLRDVNGNPVDAPVEWSTSDPSIGTIDAAGLLRIADSYAACDWVAPPKCGLLVDAQSGGVSDRVALFVSPQLIVTVTPLELSLRVGESAPIRVEATVEGNNVTWCPGHILLFARNREIATVAGNMVTGVAPGSTEMIVSVVGSVGQCQGGALIPVTVTDN